MKSSINILFWVPYPHNTAPGQRFRHEQYLGYFAKNNITYTLSPFWDIKTNAILYQHGKHIQKIAGLVNGYFRRLKDILHISRFDLVFIYREAAPIGPPVIEWLITKVLHKKILFDFDDSIWLKDVSEAHKLWGWLKNPSKTRNIIKLSSGIIVGNKYLAEYASKFNSAITIIPTTIDTDYHFSSNKIIPSNKITIGWTGSTTTIKHFETALPFLKRLKLKYKDRINFVLISDKNITHSPLEIDFIPWTKETEISDLSRIDIGIMPLPDDQWSKGKCGFKGLQYMAMGIATVMSPVGVNMDIISDGTNGFLAKTEDEWVEKLSLLIESSELRANFGLAGRLTIRKRYSVKSQKDSFLEIFTSLTRSEKQAKTD